MSVNEKKWLVMHMHVQLKLDELQGPPNPWLTVTCDKVLGQLLPSLDGQVWTMLVSQLLSAAFCSVSTRTRKSLFQA